jgi:Tfp pilus assembly protein PilN
MARQINLYDPSLRRKREWLTLGNVGLLGGLLVVLVGVAGVLTRSPVAELNAQVATNDAQLKTLRDQITALGQQVAGRKSDPQVERDINTVEQLLSMRGQVVDVLKRRMGPQANSFGEYLRGLARQTTPGLWLTGIAVNSGGDGIEIAGRTVDPSLLPAYIRRLNQEEAFRGQAFAALDLAEGKPDTPAPGSAAPGSPAAVVKAPYHEFKLVPVQASQSHNDKSRAPAMLSRGTAAGGES